MCVNVCVCVCTGVCVLVCVCVCVRVCVCVCSFSTTCLQRRSPSLSIQHNHRSRSLGITSASAVSLDRKDGFRLSHSDLYLSFTESQSTRQSTLRCDHIACQKPGIFLSGVGSFDSHQPVVNFAMSPSFLSVIHLSCPPHTQTHTNTHTQTLTHSHAHTHTHTHTHSLTPVITVADRFNRGDVLASTEHSPTIVYADIGE